MRLLDTDVMVDVLREYPPAVEWLYALDDEEELGIPGFVVMELLDGCRNKEEMGKIQRLVRQFIIYWPAEADCHRALADFARERLASNLSVMDALIGHCAVGLGVSLCTFNVRHFSLIEGLRIEQPYGRKLS